jgi:DNA polymerase III delta prime subunit
MATGQRVKDEDWENLGPIGAWKDIEEFRQSKFFAEFLNRLVTGRDMNIIITAASETGVGKTTLAYALAVLMDQHGWTAEKAAVANPMMYDRLYDASPPGTCLILDEAEKAADNRRGMTKESVTLSQTFAAKRYQQIFSILTAPSKSWVDSRLGADAADYWLQAQQTDKGRIKGEAVVYRLKTNEHERTPYTERVERIHWPNMDDSREFQKLDKRKREILESDSGRSFVHADEVEDIREEAAQDARQDERDRIIRALNERDEPVATQEDIAEVVGLSKTRVNQIVNS